MHLILRVSSFLSHKNTAPSPTYQKPFLLRSALLWMALMAASMAYAQQPFITTWKTDNAGTSNSTSITIPTLGGGYNYEADWNNDGTYDQSGITGSVTHDFGVAGTYTIRIRGAFPTIFFSNDGDRLKLLDIGQWGDQAWTTMLNVFTKKFLENGFRVKVSATDISRQEKYAHLSGLPHAENLELVPLDVQNLAQLQAFAEGCDILVHGGTPFQLDVEEPQRDLFDPTVKGTENFLEVVSDSPTVKKVVFIASVAVMNTNFPLLPPGKAEGDQISEADTFYFHAENHPYAQAKFMANQAVDQFIADHPDLSFEITSFSPVGVMGMAMSKREDSTSMGLQFLFKNKIAPNPFIQMLYDQDVLWALVDVEDVAEGTFKAATTSGIHGKNYLLSSESYRVSDIISMLNQEMPAGQARVVYRNDLAKNDLNMDFKPASVPLREYSNIGRV